MFGRLIAEPGCGARFRFCRFFFPVLRWRVRFRGKNETSRDGRYFLDRQPGMPLVCFRRL